MKKKVIGFFALLFFVGTVSAQVSSEAFTLTPKTAMPGQKLSFNYNSAITPLNNSKTINIALYIINNGAWEVIEPKITKKEKQYSGSFTIPSGATVVAVKVKNEKKTDNNKGKGYLFPVYDKTGKIVPGYYADLAMLNSGMGQYLVEMENDADAAYTALNEGMLARPELLQDRNFVSALTSANSRKFKTEAIEKNKILLQNFASKANLDFKDLDFLSGSYKRLKMEDKAAEYAAMQQSKFPIEVERANALKAFAAEKDTDKKAAMFTAFEAKFPFEKEDKSRGNYISGIANAYGRDKNYSKFNEWNKKLEPAAAASTYNNVAWNMAEAGEQMEEAKKMSLEAVNFAAKEMKQSASKKPKDLTLSDWKERTANVYAMYADTYSFINEQMGDYKTAHKYGLDAARLSKFENKEYNERYVSALAKVEQPAVAMPIIEKMIQGGHATQKIKDVLKTLYVTKTSGNNGYEAYLSQLEKSAKEKRKAALIASMINEPAPSFSLKDTEGKLVSLADLKGKTILVDFWATWCGPCIASMPGLNMAVNKHKDNKDVQFLFVDTWEQAKDKTQNAVDFMKSKNYPFYVLMDTEDKMVADYKVAGIPTKFIIDKNGNVRFKVVGFEGNTEELAEEIDMMLELASKP